MEKMKLREIKNDVIKKIDKKKNWSKSEKEQKCIYVRSIHLLQNLYWDFIYCSHYCCNSDGDNLYYQSILKFHLLQKKYNHTSFMAKLRTEKVSISSTITFDFKIISYIYYY